MVRAIAIAIAFAALAAAPAFADQCPAERARDNPLRDAPTASNGVTEDALVSIDLADYGQRGRELRSRRLTVQPGGVVALHHHDARAATFYVVSGEVMEFRSDCAVPVRRRTGDATSEHGHLAHWLRNDGAVPVVMVVTDIFGEEEQHAH